MLGAGAQQSYSAGGGPQVSLAKGSFKHIAVLTADPTPVDVDGQPAMQLATDDGGGTAPTAGGIKIRMSDLAKLEPDPTKNWQSWYAGSTALIGWIDIAKLIDGDGGGVAAGGAPAAPAAPAAR